MTDNNAINVPQKVEIIERTLAKNRLVSKIMFITINTNIRMAEDDPSFPPLKEKLRNVVKMFADPLFLSKWVKFTPQAEKEGAVYDSKHIKDVNIQAAVEIGGKEQRVHLHMSFSVRSWSPVSLSTGTTVNHYRSLIEQLVMSQIPEIQGKPYVNIRNGNSTMGTLYDYLSKQAL